MFFFYYFCKKYIFYEKICSFWLPYVHHKKAKAANCI